MSGKLPMVNVNFGSAVESAAVCDTASSRTLISREFFNRIKNEYCVKQVMKINESIQTAGNNRLVVRHAADIHFKIGKYSWTFNFWITKQSPFNVILGFDFFKYSQMSCDIGKGTIGFKFSTSEINCLMTDDDYGTEQNIQLEESVLSEEQQLKLRDLISTYGDVLKRNLGRAKCPPYEIKMRGKPTPIQSRPYQCTPVRMQALKQIISKMLDQKVIEISKSNWSSPAFVVPKREENKYRMVCDFRKINEHIELDLFPTPHMETLFQYMQKARYFTSLDLLEAYHQIPISENSKQYTAFSTPFGHYQYNTIPQGIKIGSQALARLTQTVFSDLLYDKVLCFADDLVIFSETADQHIKDIQEVFNRLRSANLTVNPDKISLAKNGVKFLGFIIKNGKFFIDPERTKAIREYKPPKTLKQLQRFLGMVSFFNRFLENFAAICAPLNKLKRKGVKFAWGQREQNSFDQLKKLMISPPTLHLPDYSKLFILNCDASESALGAVLGQMVNDVWVPIAYASRTLNRTEASYSIYKKEALGCVWGCERFKDILSDHPFILRTDNEALSSVLKPSSKNSLFARWKLRLSQFDFKIEHVRSSQNLCADSLSRMFSEHIATTHTEQRNQGVTQNEHEKCLILQHFPDVFNDLEQNQLQDVKLGPIINKLQNKVPVPNFFIRQKILKYKKNKNCPFKIVLPSNMRNVIMKYHHDSAVAAHLGIKKTTARIARNFTWEGMFADIKNYVRSCPDCQLSKQAQNQQFGLMFSRPAEHVFQRVYMDLFGPLVRSKQGFSYILTVVDAYSKFVFLRPLRKATSDSIIRDLKENIFSQHGFPKIIVTDHGSQFTSSQFKSFLFGLGVKHITTSVANPKANCSERNNKNLKTALKIYSSQQQTKWDVNLAYLTLAFNSAPHESHKRTPSSVFLGRELNHPLTLLWNLDSEGEITNETAEDKVRAITRELRATHQKTKAQYDKNRKPSPYQVNDLVLYRKFVHSNKAKQISHKLTQIWQGPFVVTEVMNPVNVKIQLVSDPSTNKVVHVAQLKRYYARSDESELLA